MAEVLTQNQIDELLNAMGNKASENIVEKRTASDEVQWIKYDFSSPKKFTKDRLRVLKGVYDNYASIMSMRLNGMLRTVCEIEVVSIEEQRYFEFHNMLSEHDVMMVGMFSVGESQREYPITYHISTQMMVMIIDRLLGGSLESQPEIAFDYSYSEIESMIYQQTMKKIIEIMNDVWENYANVHMISNSIVETPGLFKEISLDESVVIGVLNIKVHGSEGILTICIPGNLLSEILGVMELSRKVIDDDEVETLKIRKWIMNSICQSSIEIQAKLASTTVNIKDVYDLSPGDVLDLNIPSDSSVEVLVEEQPWYQASLGVYKNNIALEIKEQVVEDVAK